MIRALLSIAASVAAWLVSPARRRQQRQRDKLEIAREVHQHDSDGVNRRLKKLLAVAAIAGAAALSGCEGVVIVTADREVVPMDRDGVSGWFVPDAVLEDLIRAADAAQNGD